MYVHDKGQLSWIRSGEQGEKRELKNEAIPTMLLKTHVEKMSVLATPTIFMKTSDLGRDSHDIHENKGSCAPGQAGREEAMRDEKGNLPISRESKPELPKAHAHELNAPNAHERSAPARASPE
jgi:hypothetical protein